MLSHDCLFDSYLGKLPHLEDSKCSRVTCDVWRLDKIGARVIETPVQLNGENRRNWWPAAIGIFRPFVENVRQIDLPYQFFGSFVAKRKLKCMCILMWTNENRSRSAACDLKKEGFRTITYHHYQSKGFATFCHFPGSLFSSRIVSAITIT